MKIGDEIPEGQAANYLTPREAAERVRVHVRTIKGWIADGKVRVRYTVGGHPRIWEPSLWKDRDWRPPQPFQ